MPQYDDEAEQVVLGSIIQAPAMFAEISDIVKVEDFFSEKNRIIFKEIGELVDSGAVFDEMVLSSSLKDKGLLEKAGNRSYIAQITSQGSPIAVGRYAQKVKALSMRRNLLSSIKQIESDLHNPQVDLDEILSDTEKALFHVSNRFSQYNVQHVKSVNDEFKEFLKNVKSSDGITGIPTKFPDFDHKTNGLKGGQLIILAARPAVGKTTLALNMASNIAVLVKKPALIFSLEMTRLELFTRMVCARGYLSSERLQKGMFNQKELEKLLAACQDLYAADIYIDDSADLTTWDFKQRSRRLAMQLSAENKQLGVIVVDYLQLMQDKSRQSEGRQQEVASISRNLKLIAKELNVPIIALSQMNRSIEQRGKDPRPQLSDLRESGSIEQDADIVMFLHREELYNKDLPETEQNIADLILAKHRAGPTGTIKLFFNKNYNLFMPLDASHHSQGEAVG